MNKSEETSLWHRLMELVSAALERPVDERQAFIDEAAGHEAELHARASALVAAAASADSLLDRPPGKLVLDALDDHPPSWAGRRLGPYRLVELIGGGGMGQVYLAERVDGQYEQRVAIKLMRDGFGRDLLVSRFKAERQILASLDHPNLAKVLDGGISEEGVPYFVMELIRGEPIDAYCNSHSLSIAQRLTLFRTVCQVVHYAHQRGVIHRDLKPANILVTREGVVKLVDFGIAKQVAAMAVTATAQRAMTLDYASPEQVRGEAVTPASDIFSLGVVLYRLLADAGPYPADTSDYELTKAICDTEPQPPSTHTDRAKRKQLRGDLDAVVMMALRKDPARRYASAEQFGDDLFRHLEGLPVQARDGALSYRAGRLVLRHKRALGATMLALVAGIAVSSYQAYEAHLQRQRAERHFASVRQLANVFIFDIHDAIRDLPGSTPARKLMVEKALAYLHKLSAEAGGDAMLLVEIAAGYRKVGDAQGRPNGANLGDSKGAMVSYDQAKTLLEPLVIAPGERNANFRVAQQELALVYKRQGELLGSLGKLKEAAAVLRSGLAVATDLAAADPSHHANQLRVAAMYGEQSILLLDAGDFDAYVRVSDTETRLIEAILSRAPDDRDALAALATTYNVRAEYLLKRDATAASARQALVAISKTQSLMQRLHEQSPDNASLARDVAVSHSNTSFALRRIGDSKQAAQELRTAITLLSPLVGNDPNNVGLRIDQALANTDLSEALLSQGDVAGSVDAAQGALTIYESLPAGARMGTEVRHNQGNGYFRLGRALEERAASRGRNAAQARIDLREACSRYRQALATLEELKDSASIAPGYLQPDTVRKAMQHCPPQSRAQA